MLGLAITHKQNNPCAIFDGKNWSSLMAHPNGGSGNTFQARNDFDQIYEYVGNVGVEFCSTTGQKIFAKRSVAKDKITKIIVFHGDY